MATKKDRGLDVSQVRKRRSHTVYIRVPNEIYDEAVRLADADGSSVAYILRKWIEKGSARKSA